MPKPARPVNHPPSWAPGTYVWKLCLGDGPDALEDAAEIIAAVANRLDGSVKQVVFLTNAIGSDEGKLPWDGVWPYWGRVTRRVTGGWAGLGAFMREMRERHDASISFHVNLTDVNAGLTLYPETRAFFKRLRAAKAVYARPQGEFNNPWFGLPVVPKELPAGRNPSDIVALVDYRRYWDSGLAKEQIDGLLDRLPYVPPLLYVDVLGPKGWCYHPGYPDGDLGGSLASQMSGVRDIVAYLASRGCAVAGESPDRMFEHQTITYSWSHGGLARNDYAQIGSGYGTGSLERRGGKGMQVYGNQGGYHAQGGTAVPDLIRNGFPDPLNRPLHSRLYDGLREWGDADDLVRQFHLTVAPELLHIASGAVRLPGGADWKLLDEHHGRARVDLLTVRTPDGACTAISAADSVKLGTATVIEDTWATGGKTVGDIDAALGNGVEFAVTVAKAGRYDCFLRYASVGGAEVAVQVGDGAYQRVTLNDTGAWNHYGEHRLRLALKAGATTIRVQRGLLAAEWSDGARAEWDIERGFRAWHGDVEFGVGGDRFCPVLWRTGKEAKRILLFSQDGGSRSWRLPATWRGVAAVTCIPLTATGRDLARAKRSAVRDGVCRITMEAGGSAVLLPA